jgi:hydroxymethylpyrimidine pyrophosphatase-like HAD family hydrolase
MNLLGALQRYNINTMSTGAPPLVLCTGRSVAFTQAFCQVLAVHRPCVCENGSMIYHPADERAVYHPAISVDHLRELSELRRRMAADRPSLRVDAGSEACLSVTPASADPPPLQALLELSRLLSEQIDNRRFSISCSTVAVHINPLGVDKGSGVRALAAIHDLSPRNLLGIGTSPADLALLQSVGYPAAPANAIDEVKSAACYVSQKQSADGVVDIIEELLQPRH